MRAVVQLVDTRMVFSLVQELNMSCMVLTLDVLKVERSSCVRPEHP